MVCLLITRALKDEGYEVTAVSDGRAGLEAARTAQPAFDLVVTNTWMRGLSGSELIARLRLDFPAVPILHIDDLGSHTTSAQFREEVATLYKPFSISALRKAVAELLAPTEQEDTP
jgi:DNA-binding response OmpR family regulator